MQFEIVFSPNKIISENFSNIEQPLKDLLKCTVCVAIASTCSKRKWVGSVFIIMICWFIIKKKIVLVVVREKNKNNNGN